MFYGETEKIQIFKNKQKEEGPSKLSKNQICVNLSHCRYKIVVDVCEKMLNWKTFKNDPYNLNCDLIWFDTASCQDLLGKLKNYQKMNHFPGIEGIARKNFLAYHLKKMQKKYPEYFNFFPDTYCLPSDNSKIFKIFANKKTKKTFIIKPEGGAQGRGIYLIRKFEQIPFQENVIMQEYLEDPLLIDNHKFDLRIYVLVTSCNPLTIYLFEEGIARFSTDIYQKPNKENMQNMYQHLTNYSINKNSDKFFFSEDADDASIGHKRSLKSVWTYLEKIGKDSQAVKEEIKKIILKTLTSVQPILQHMYVSCQPNDITGSMCYEILGFDIILDSQLKPYLLEVNHAPSLNSDTPFDIKNKSELIYGALQIAQITIQNRNELIKLEKKKFQERIIGKRIKVSQEKKDELKEEFRQRYDQIDSKKFKFEKIYPNDNLIEPYEEFMQFSHESHKIRTGVDNKIIKKRQKSVKNKQDKFKEKIIKKHKVLDEKTIKEKQQMILNQVNRLYKIPDQSNKENMVKQRRERHQSQKPNILVPVIKPNVVNLVLNLQLVYEILLIFYLLTLYKILLKIIKKMKQILLTVLAISVFSVTKQNFGSAIMSVFDICSSTQRPDNIKQEHNNQRNEQALQEVKNTKQNIQNTNFDIHQYIFNNSVPLQCQNNLKMFLKIDSNNYISQGGQSMVFGYDDKNVMKITIMSPDDKETLKKASDEFEYMNKFAREDNILFSYRPSCYIEYYNGKIHFLLKQEKRQDSLAYSPSNNIYGGEKIFQIQNLSNNVKNRFVYYDMLFEQLEVFYEDDLVHSDIKPENIMTNIKFQDIIDGTKQLAELELHIIDYGLMVKEGNKEYSGTINFMHPYFAFKIQQKRIHELDVYQLCLTILVVEMYQQNYDDEFLFQMASNLQYIEDLKQSSNGQQPSDEQVKQMADSLLETYRQFFMDMYILSHKQQQFEEDLKNFKNDNYKDFYKKNCMNNFRCVLISVFQSNFDEFPSASQLRNAFKIIQKKEKELIIQFKI